MMVRRKKYDGQWNSQNNDLFYNDTDDYDDDDVGDDNNDNDNDKWNGNITSFLDKICVCGLVYICTCDQKCHSWDVE